MGIFQITEASDRTKRQTQVKFTLFLTDELGHGSFLVLGAPDSQDFRPRLASTPPAFLGVEDQMQTGNCGTSQSP